MKFFKHTFLGVCSLIILAAFAISLVQQYYPYKPIVIDSPIKILTKRVKAGELMTYQVHYCLYMEGSATVYRTLYNDKIIPLAGVQSVAKGKGCHTNDIQVTIPLGSEPGIYHMEGIDEFHISATRNIDVPFKSEDFEVY